MPPPSNQRADIEPPPQVTKEATMGFITGAVRIDPIDNDDLPTQFGALSILAHLILSLPHPMHFTSSTSNAANGKPPPPPKPMPTPLIYRPLVSFSNSIAPMSRVYRGLTPQFKTFIQISIMTLGGCIWAEKRVGEYLDVVRKIKRAERRARDS
ncbi:uncharacterized protein TERG_06643 [Trichophyton rubrum CBS 118892]|uniref:Uncharacterized protein n=1 Tax=Trichophyton rubrum (strain ATCC MYA-4607 / CBS 118892) TaxID=559305 RepID=F2SVS1_TRIRC|nr:uncharacterized protein TERG_06643 [Trichophyton rubrum CBS 118892]EGD90415.2 hypothetical protein TERG_06643 [Trichophyton rubrum CBS 118892]